MDRLPRSIKNSPESNWLSKWTELSKPRALSLFVLNIYADWAVLLRLDTYIYTWFFQKGHKMRDSEICITDLNRNIEAHSVAVRKICVCFRAALQQKSLSSCWYLFTKLSQPSKPYDALKKDSIINAIKDSVRMLSMRTELALLLILTHCGFPGNEMADEFTKAGENLVATPIHPWANWR